MEKLVYSFLAVISTATGFYVGIFFVRLWQRLTQPPYYRMPFLMLGLVNIASGVVYFLGLIQYDGFAVVSSTGKIIRVLIIGFQIMPYIMAKSMQRMK